MRNNCLQKHVELEHGSLLKGCLPIVINHLEHGLLTCTGLLYQTSGVLIDIISDFANFAHANLMRAVPVVVGHIDGLLHFNLREAQEPLNSHVHELVWHGENHLEHASEWS